MKSRLATAALVQKWSLGCQLRFQFKNEASVTNCTFSSKMKLQLSIEILTKMMKKYIFFNDIAPTWHQRGQFEHKFQKVTRSYFLFFNKWVILTQNSSFVLIVKLASKILMSFVVETRSHQNHLNVHSSATFWLS